MSNENGDKDTEHLKEPIDNLNKEIGSLKQAINTLKEKEMNDKIKELRDDIEILDRWITVGAENGLFYDTIQYCCESHKEPNKCESSAPIPSNFKEAQDMLKTVFNELYCKDNIDVGLCETYLSKVNLFYNNTLQKKTRQWKFTNIYGGYVIIYLGLLLVSFTYLLSFDMFSKIEIHSNRVLFEAALMGFLGGLTKSSYDLLNAVKLRVYRRANDINYFLGPFIGAVFGFIGVLIILSGLNIETTQTDQTQTTQSYNPNGLYVIAFASALFWERIIDKLKSIIGDKMNIKENEGVLKKQE